MDETETNLQRNSEEEESGDDDFYEKIEAPKFVDLTAPDPYRYGDDRYWFCSRVGCDQQHEEEMDSEAIYKNFVLRVMAARSPNIRLRKALYRKDSCGIEMKCPQTVPAKPSKSRVSRLALISSVSKRIVDPKVKIKPMSRQNATPNAKAKQPSDIAKALTTPRTKKKLSNPDTFRSVRNPKTTATAVSKNRVVAKTLVFRSPKKSVKIKSSLELKTPMKTLCAGMKKLEITSGRTQVLGYNRPLPSDTTRKQLRGREVKSRVFDGLLTQNHKLHDAKSSKGLKKNHKGKNLQQNHDPVPHEKIGNDVIDKEMVDRRRNDSQGMCSSLKFNEGNVNEGPSATIEASKPKPSLDEEKYEASLDGRRSNLNSPSITEKRSSGDDDNSISESQAPKEIKEKDDEGDISTFEDKENDNEVMESDDKENASASNSNRELDGKSSHKENKILRKSETLKSNKKTTKAKINQPKESSASAKLLQHKKPKPTNPKPFRLRTDERGILKEANLEKKNCPPSLGDITSVPRIPGGNLQKKHQNGLQRNESCLEQNENYNNANENNENGKKDQPKNRTFSLKISEERAERKLSSTPQTQRHTISSQQKLVTLQQECSQDKSAVRMGKSSKRTELARFKESASTRMNSNMTTAQLGAIMENSPTILRAKEAAAKPSETDAFLGTKASSVSPASKPSLQGKRFATIPKEPNFHTIHTPKSCTKRAA